MFLEFYGLKEHPFGVTPDLRFICPSRTHSKAFHSLSRGLEAGCGFLTLIAKPGLGKTTLVFQLLKEFNQTCSTAFLFQTQCNSLELLHYLLCSLGIDNTGLDAVSMHEKLNRFLAREFQAGRRLVVVIDECQNLDNSALETLRLLSDFETPKTKLIQIILVGQTQFLEKLSSPNLVQLRQRISIFCRLEPLGREESLAYIQHRLQVAGYAGASPFASEALEKIVTHSEGIPRNINNLCFNALLAGYEAGRKQIHTALVEQVIADLDMKPPEPQRAVTQQERPALAQARTVYPGFDLSVIHPGTPRVDIKKSNSANARKPAAESGPSPTEPLLQGPQAQPPSPAQRVQASDLSVAPSGFPHSESNLRDGRMRHTDFDADSTAREPHATLQIGQSQETERDSSPVRENALKHTQVASSESDIPRLPTASEGFGRRVWAISTLAAALLLAGLFLFYSGVGASRRSQYLIGTGVARASTLEKTPPTFHPSAKSSSTADPLSARAPIGQPLIAHMGESRIDRIVIDPGHGGYDTGATGPTGLVEKQICLDLAVRLARIIKERLPDAEVILTRTNDTYVPLEARTHVANEMNADVFLSIHVNSSPYQEARGAETYYLSVTEPLPPVEIAVRENVTAHETVASRLAQMKANIRQEKMEESRVFAEDVQDSLSHVIGLSTNNGQNRSVKRAPLVVLAGANMPSVLTEISFLTNPADEQLLGQVDYREHLAKGLYQGVATYLQGLSNQNVTREGFQ